MFNQRPFRFAKEFALGSKILVFHPAFCILSLVFLPSIATPSLAAPAGWAATYGGSYNDSAASIQQTGDGGYIVAGRTDSFGAGRVDFLVLKLRQDGTVEWQKTYGGAGEDWAASIQQSNDGGYIAARYTGSFYAEIPDIWVLKLGPDGSINPACDFIYDVNTPGADSNATILDSNAGVLDSDASPRDVATVIQNTGVSANVLCQ